MCRGAVIFRGGVCRGGAALEACVGANTIIYIKTSALWILLSVEYWISSPEMLLDIPVSHLLCLSEKPL